MAYKEKETFEALTKYRQRNTIETFFRGDKQTADGLRPRVWSVDTLRGRMFVQFEDAFMETKDLGDRWHSYEVTDWDEVGSVGEEVLKDAQRLMEMGNAQAALLIAMHMFELGDEEDLRSALPLATNGTQELCRRDGQWRPCRRLQEARRRHICWQNTSAKPIAAVGRLWQRSANFENKSTYQHEPSGSMAAQKFQDWMAERERLLGRVKELLLRQAAEPSGKPRMQS